MYYEIPLKLSNGGKITGKRLKEKLKEKNIEDVIWHRTNPKLIAKSVDDNTEIASWELITIKVTAEVLSTIDSPIIIEND